MLADFFCSPRATSKTRQDIFWVPSRLTIEANKRQWHGPQEEKKKKKQYHPS